MSNALAVQGIVAAPLSADDRDVHLYPTAAFLPFATEWMRWQTRLTTMSFRSAVDNGPVSPSIYAEALQHQYRERQRHSRHGRKASCAGLLMRLAWSNAAVTGRASDVPSRSHGQHRRSSHRRIKPGSSHSGNSSSSHCRGRSASHLSQPIFTGSRLLEVQALVSMSSHQSSGQSLSAAPSLGQQNSVQSDHVTGSIEASALSQPSFSSQDSEQAEVESLGSSTADTPAVQSPDSVMNSVSFQTGQGFNLQLCAASVARNGDSPSGFRASAAPKHRLSRCTRAADLEAEGSKYQHSSSSPAQQWLRSMSLGSDTIRAGAMREAGRLMRRASTSDMAVKVSSMTAEARKRSGEWLQGQKDSWSIPASFTYSAGNSLILLSVSMVAKVLLAFITSWVQMGFAMQPKKSCVQMPIPVLVAMSIQMLAKDLTATLG